MQTVSVKKKKMLLVFPIIVVPFLTMAFWALGGGKGEKKTVETMGLNTEMPGSNLKEDKTLNKLSFYEQAEKDSVKRQEFIRSDPYFKTDSIADFSNQLDDFNYSTRYGQQLNTNLYEKPLNNPEDQLMNKLNRLKDQLNKPVKTPEIPIEPEQYDPVFTPMGEDPDIKQLSGALDKILDIQHPERVRERSVKNKGSVYAVRSDTGTDTLVNGFYSYSDEKELQDQNAIEAMVAANQTIVNGAIVKFRTLNVIFVNGKQVPPNTQISGIAALEGERLRIEINSIRFGKSVFSVNLELYDLDGLPGIYIPGTINRDVAKESLNNSLSLADMTALDPSLKAQATTRGMDALKSLVSKKAKLVRVQLKAGYKVLFKNKNQDL